MLGAGSDAAIGGSDWFGLDWVWTKKCVFA